MLIMLQHMQPRFAIIFGNENTAARIRGNQPFVFRPQAERISRCSFSGSIARLVGPLVPPGSFILVQDSAPSVERYKAPSPASMLHPRFACSRSEIKPGLFLFGRCARQRVHYLQCPYSWVCQLLPPSTDLYTPLLQKHKRTMSVFPDCSQDRPEYVSSRLRRYPGLRGFQILPASSPVNTPPSYCLVPLFRHIFGRGRSCVPLITAHTRPLPADQIPASKYCWPMPGELRYFV